MSPSARARRARPVRPSHREGLARELHTANRTLRIGAGHGQVGGRLPLTIVGDIAQATGPLAPSRWEEVLDHLPETPLKAERVDQLVGRGRHPSGGRYALGEHPAPRLAERDVATEDDLPVPRAFLPLDGNRHARRIAPARRVIARGIPRIQSTPVETPSW